MPQQRTFTHRFEPEIVSRISTALENLETGLMPSSDDTAEESARKSEALARLTGYKKTAMPKRLTTDRVDALLDATGWTRKQFYEICLDENRDISSASEKRAELVWPNREMEETAEVLDRASQETVIKFKELVTSQLPAAYARLQETLDEYDKEFRDVSENMPEPKKRSNMGIRIYESMRFLINDEDTLTRLCTENGITYGSRTRRRKYFLSHYWMFSPSDAKRICSAFDLTPHWVLCGEDGDTLLAEKAETEEIMDLFQFVPKENQKVLLTALLEAVQQRS